MEVTSMTHIFFLNDVLAGVTDANTILENTNMLILMMGAQNMNS